MASPYFWLTNNGMSTGNGTNKLYDFTPPVTQLNGNTENRGKDTCTRVYKFPADQIEDKQEARESSSGVEEPPVFGLPVSLGYLTFSLIYFNPLPHYDDFEILLEKEKLLLMSIFMPPHQ